MCDKYSYFKQNTIYFSLMLSTRLLIVVQNRKGFLCQTFILMFPRGEYTYSSNRKHVNTSYGILQVKPLGQSER